MFHNQSKQICDSTLFFKTPACKHFLLYKISEYRTKLNTKNKITCIVSSNILFWRDSSNTTLHTHQLGTKLGVGLIFLKHTTYTRQHTQNSHGNPHNIAKATRPHLKFLDMKLKSDLRKVRPHDYIGCSNISR